jgi:hypothetical protein
MMMCIGSVANWTKLTGLLQERYGYTQKQAEQEIDRRLQEYGDKVAGVVASVSAKAQEFGATAAKKANQVAPVIGEKMESVATSIRERAPGDGTLGTTTTKVAEGWNRQVIISKRRNLTISEKTSDGWFVVILYNLYWSVLAWAFCLRVVTK